MDYQFRGKAAQIYTNRLRLLQKKAIRIITNSDYLAHTRPLFKKLNILTFDDMFDHQLACIMWNYDNGCLPSSLSEYFRPVNETHNYCTRMATSGKLSTDYRIRTETHGKKLLKFTGPRILNNLKELEFYRDSKTSKAFVRNHKQFLLSKY